MDCCVKEEWPLGRQDLKTPSKVTHILKLWLFSSGPDFFLSNSLLGCHVCVLLHHEQKEELQVRVQYGQATSQSMRRVWIQSLNALWMKSCSQDNTYFLYKILAQCYSNPTMRFPYQSRVLLTVTGQNKTGCISLGMFVEAVDNGSMLLAMGQYLTT